MKLSYQVLAVAIALGVAIPVLPALAQDKPLIPREVLFGNPSKASPRISPDGTQLSVSGPARLRRAAELHRAVQPAMDRAEIRIHPLG